MATDSPVAEDDGHFAVGEHLDNIEIVAPADLPENFELAVDVDGKTMIALIVSW